MIEPRFNPSSRYYELVWHRANGADTLVGREWEMAAAPTFVPEGWRRA